MATRFDCVVCGEVCVDLPVHPIDQRSPLAGRELIRVEPIRPRGGGIVANSGLAMARLGLKTAAVGCLGDDVWGDFLVKLLGEHGVEARYLTRNAEFTTSATAVLVGEDGEHTFAYHGGASQRFGRQTMLDNLELFGQSSYALVGYYGLLTAVEDDLPEVLAEVRRAGCKTALDTSGGGGTMQPLDRILPHLDIYVPSYSEAKSQTGLREPETMIEIFRQYCPRGLLGIKLGKEGAVLSPGPNEWIRVRPVKPPGRVVDTTGAGDCFYAGLITALARGRTVEQAGRLGAAAGACCVTGVGAIEGVRDYEETCLLADVDEHA